MIAIFSAANQVIQGAIKVMRKAGLDTQVSCTGGRGKNPAEFEYGNT